MYPERIPSGVLACFVFLCGLSAGSLLGCTETQSTISPGESDADVGDEADVGWNGGNTDPDTSTNSAPNSSDPSCTDGQFQCGESCCAEGMDCVDEQCQEPCPGTVCGEDESLCCTDEELCFGGGCVTPGDECERTEECGLEEICEPSVGRCLPRDQIAVCEFIPPTGEFNPDVGCNWFSDGLDEFPDRGDIVALPVVANLTDDNGDGVTNADDIPNIVFPSFNRNESTWRGGPSTVRILDGDCREDGTYETIASISEPAVQHDSGMALADLNGNGVPELIGVTNLNEWEQGMDAPFTQGTVAFTRVTDDGTEWEVLWHNTDYPTWSVHTRGAVNVSVADLDGDGNPEVIVGNVVLNGQDGSLLWDGVETSGGEGGIGNNAFLGPSSVVADITLDGTQEVLAGNTAYDHAGNVLWTYEFTHATSWCEGQLTCDGFTGVANITGETDHPNIVIIRQGDVYVLDYQGNLVWEFPLPMGDCIRQGEPSNESGPPTIADFNGDGELEIGTAGADYYVIVKRSCDTDNWEELGCEERGILWKSPIDDCSSRATASSVFDFHGDGRAEVVYADEEAFRIYDGSTGDIVFEDTRHESNTRIEMPIIADTNNDGRAEVLVPSAYVNRGERPGLWTWSDPNGHWVRTRRIWNQHAYHVTNINEDGSVPAIPEQHWANPRLNSFRQNVQPDGLFDAPDLVARDMKALNTPFACGNEGVLQTHLEVANEGALGVAAGVAVDVHLIRETTVVETQRVHTTERLLPGQSEQIALEWSLDSSLLDIDLELHATVDPDAEINECDTDNNDVTLEDVRCDIQG